MTSDTIDPPNREPVTEESIHVEPTTSIVMKETTSVEQEHTNALLSPINQSQAHQIDYKLIQSMRDQVSRSSMNPSILLISYSECSASPQSTRTEKSSNLSTSQFIFTDLFEELWY